MKHMYIAKTVCFFPIHRLKTHNIYVIFFHLIYLKCRFLGSGVVICLFLFTIILYLLFLFASVVVIFSLVITTKLSIENYSICVSGRHFLVIICVCCIDAILV